MSIEQVRFVEELAANAWRPEIEQHLGGWRLRYSGGTSRRVNSVWPNASPKMASIQESLEFVEAFYRRRSASSCFQLCPAALPAELPQILTDRGYASYAHTAVQIQSISGLLSRTSPPVGAVIASDALTDEWFDLYTSSSGYSPESLPIRRGVLSRIGPAAQFVSLENQGKQVATGLGVLERGWLGVFCVVTASPFRRMGFAVGVMHALALWGKEQGADHVYLQVMENNPSALNLYQKLGFSRLHQYYYAIKDGKDEKDH
jgi:GNAT superfamily N-acetyltransferase